MSIYASIEGIGDEHREQAENDTAGMPADDDPGDLTGYRAPHPPNRCINLADGPTVAECAKADRRWALERAGE